MTRTTFATDVRDIASSRRDRRVDAGIRLTAAARLAADPRYDVPALTDLVARGCPPGLAARILAPLEQRDPA